MKALLHLLTSAVLTTLLIQSATAQQAISPYVVAAGGGLETGSTSTIVATVGQPIAAAANGILAGFWYTSASLIETSIEEGPTDPSIPATFKLNQNYPNPFNPSTTITYELPASGDVLVSIVDALGRRVSSIRYSGQSAGVHSITWDGRDDTGAPVPSGLYWYRVRTESGSAARMMVLVK